MKSYEKAYPCVGGPLNGQLVKRSEFAPARRYVQRPEWNREAGPFADHAEQYVSYNRAGRQNVPAMIWLFKDLLP